MVFLTLPPLAIQPTKATVEKDMKKLKKMTAAYECVVKYVL